MKLNLTEVASGNGVVSFLPWNNGFLLWSNKAYPAIRSSDNQNVGDYPLLPVELLSTIQNKKCGYYSLAVNFDRGDLSFKKNAWHPTVNTVHPSKCIVYSCEPNQSIVKTFQTLKSKFSKDTSIKKNVLYFIDKDIYFSCLTVCYGIESFYPPHFDRHNKFWQNHNWYYKPLVI